jgi:hypothetical protein
LSRDFPPYSEAQRRQQLTEVRRTNKGHGRLVKRHLQASSRLAGHLDWPGLKQVIRQERITRRGDQTTVEVEYAITSLPPEKAGAEQLLAYRVGHWGIENCLHWVRDVDFGEDACREQKQHCPHNLAALRNACISLLRLEGVKEILSTLRRFATRPLDLLAFLGILKN